MLKIILFAFFGCLGLGIAFALYAAWRVTRMGQAMGRASGRDNNDYIPTTGTTIYDSDPHRNSITSTSQLEDPRSQDGGQAVGESIGAQIGENVADFGSSDSGSSDSGSSDSGGGSSD